MWCLRPVFPRHCASSYVVRSSLSSPLCALKLNSVGMQQPQCRGYRTQFTPRSCDYNLNDFVPLQGYSLEELRNQSQQKGNLITTFRRYRDVDQCEAVLHDGRSQCQAFSPKTIGSDVELACLYLNACVLFGLVTPSKDILEHLKATILPRLNTTYQVESVVSALRSLLNGTPAFGELLKEMVDQLDTMVPTMPRSAIVLIGCVYSDEGIASPMLMQGLLERAVMLKESFTTHEMSQFLLAYALSAFRNSSDVPELFAEFVPVIMDKIHKVSAQDAACLLYAFAITRLAVPELVDALGRRLHHVVHAVNADAVAMSFLAMVVMGIDNGLLRKCLCDALRAMDSADLSTKAALDIAWALTHLPAADGRRVASGGSTTSGGSGAAPLGARRLGAEEDVMDLVMNRVMADKQTVLASADGRARLLEVSAALAT